MSRRLLCSYINSYLLKLLIVLYISFIFFEEILENKACIYNQLSLLLDLLTEFLPLFLKNFDFFKIFMLGLGGMRSRTLDISAFFYLYLMFWASWENNCLGFLGWILKQGFDETFCYGHQPVKSFTQLHR